MVTPYRFYCFSHDLNPYVSCFLFLVFGNVFGNVYYNVFGKNMINGLYGSFALNDENETYIISMNETEFMSYYSKVDMISSKKIGNCFIIKIAKNIKSAKILDKEKKWEFKTKKRNVAYAAIIAAKARIKLNNSLQRVIDDGGKLYYTDTDSIFAGYKDNRLGSELGDVKWSHVYEDGVFISSKFYYLKGEELKLKGVNKNFYTFEQIKTKFYDNETSKIEFIEQLSFFRGDFEIFEKWNNKKINISEYNKRIFLKGKKETEPVKY